MSLKYEPSSEQEMNGDNQWQIESGEKVDAHFTEMCCGTEAGSYLRLIDSCITQLKAQGPSRTCNESKEEEEEDRERREGGCPQL